MSDPDRPPSLFGRTLARDDGPERGVRALALSTGGGLDFWALADRSLDIGPLWWRGTPLAWASAAGFRSPALHDPEGDGGRGFNRSFSGFVTCGLDHTRQPDGEHPLHGRLPYTPARLTAYGEDWEREEPILFCEGEAVQARYGSESLRLWRRIEAPVGGREIRIIDVVENLGAGQQRQSTLYHFNLGFPAVATGSLVRLGETVLLGPLTVPDAADAPRSESVPAGGDAEAACTVTTPVEGGDLVLTFAFATDTLPHLQIWRDLPPTRPSSGSSPAPAFARPTPAAGPSRSSDPASAAATACASPYRACRSSQVAPRAGVPDRRGSDR